MDSEISASPIGTYDPLTRLIFFIRAGPARPQHLGITLEMIKLNKVKIFNQKILCFVENVGLFVIALATVFAMATEVSHMVQIMKVNLSDLLMLFLYLEVLTMIGLYYDLGKLPVRMPMYIAMVALARYLILDMKDLNDWRMLAVSTSILLITLAVFVMQYANEKFPTEDEKHTH